MTVDEPDLSLSPMTVDERIRYIIDTTTDIQWLRERIHFITAERDLAIRIAEDAVDERNKIASVLWRERNIETTRE